jgi:glutathione S-transferase
VTKLKVYGYAQSRALRTLWLCEEIGVPYELVHVGTNDGGTRSADYLKINPAGHIPAIDDGEVRLSESMAINLYLAKKHQKLYPASAAGEAKAWQWSFWVVSELDTQIVRWITQGLLLPAGERDMRLAREAREAMEWPLQVLDRAVATQDYLVEPATFTVADLNVASVLYRLLFVDLSGKPHLEAWLKRCWDRPAAKKARALREG